MKKLLIILLLTGCTKITPTLPAPLINKDIFSVSQSTVSNSDEIMFNLKLAGIYTLTMGDSVTNQVITSVYF